MTKINSDLRKAVFLSMGQRTSPLLAFVVEKELLNKLDNFRFENRFQSRAEATRWLLEWALREGASPGKNEIEH